MRPVGAINTKSDLDLDPAERIDEDNDVIGRANPGIPELTDRDFSALGSNQINLVQSLAAIGKTIDSN